MKSIKKKFSLILSIYQKIKYEEIIDSLKSINNQVLKPDEIIVIFDD